MLAEDVAAGEEPHRGRLRNVSARRPGARQTVRWMPVLLLKLCRV